jgi:hypothetical protein
LNYYTYHLTVLYGSVLNSHLSVATIFSRGTTSNSAGETHPTFNQFLLTILIDVQK